MPLSIEKRWQIVAKGDMLFPGSMTDGRPVERQIIFLLPAGGMHRQLFRLGEIRLDVFDMRDDLPCFRPGEPWKTSGTQKKKHCRKEYKPFFHFEFSRSIFICRFYIFVFVWSLGAFVYFFICSDSRCLKVYTIKGGNTSSNYWSNVFFCHFFLAPMFKFCEPCPRGLIFVYSRCGQLAWQAPKTQKSPS